MDSKIQVQEFLIISGDVDICEAANGYNLLEFILLHHFSYISEKFVFSAGVKSRKKWFLEVP